MNRILSAGLAACAMILLAQACGKKDSDFGGTGPIIPKDTVKLDTAKPSDTLKFVTMNMSIGFPVAQLLFTDMADPVVAYDVLDSLFKRYQRTLPKERIKGMAKAIIDMDPDVVGLQEVMSFTKDGVLADDYLPDLVKSIKEQGGPEYQAYSIPLNDTVLTGSLNGNSIRVAFHEGNAMLVRPGIEILERARFIYFTLLPIPTAANTSTQRALGYMKLKTPKGVTWQVYNTHLEVIKDISSSQALEIRVLVDSLKLRDTAGMETAPQIVLGDFNADPNTNAHTVMQEGGFRDTFDTTSADPGFTCCIDNSTLWNASSAFSNRRIDFIFSRHIVKVLDHKVALKDSIQTASGAWILPSDHRAVVSQIVGQ
jgi:endonuclease/exonuclease/phosphatase family metal-dependent hydrolase